MKLVMNSYNNYNMKIVMSLSLMFSSLTDESGITYPDLVFGESGRCGTCTCRLVKIEIFNPREIKTVMVSL